MSNSPLNSFMSKLFRIDEEELEMSQLALRKSFHDIGSFQRQGSIQIVADNARSFQRRTILQRSKSEGKQRQYKIVQKQARIDDLKIWIKESRWESGSGGSQPLVQCRRFTM